jgi:uncharacterized membrane protein
MSRQWLDERAEGAFTAAVAQIEEASGIELAIAIRRSARSWPHVPFLVGIAAAWTTRAFMLFSEPAFTLASFLVDPLLAGAAVGSAATVVSPLVRWLTPNARRRRAVDAAARATFVERSVHRTRGRCGVLVYCALTERQAAVVPDVGVAAGVPAATLAGWERNITSAVARGAECREATTSAAAAAHR